MSGARSFAATLLLALAGKLTSAVAQSTDTIPAKWPGQTEGDFIIKDFHFKSAEVLPELRLHVVTLGTLHRNSLGQTDNAVLLLHSTGDDTTEFLEPIFSEHLYGPRQTFDLTKFYVIIPDAIRQGKSRNPSEAMRKPIRHHR